jgi:hypothetical protein
MSWEHFDKDMRRTILRGFLMSHPNLFHIEHIIKNLWSEDKSLTRVGLSVDTITRNDVKFWYDLGEIVKVNNLPRFYGEERPPNEPNPRKMRFTHLGNQHIFDLLEAAGREMGVTMCNSRINNGNPLPSNEFIPQLRPLIEQFERERQIRMNRR